METTSTLPTGTERKSTYTINVAVVNPKDCTMTAAYYNNNWYVTTKSAIANPNNIKVYYGSTLVRTDGDDYSITYATTGTLNPAEVGANATGAGNATVVLNDGKGTTQRVAYTIGNAAPKVASSTTYNIYASGKKQEFALKGYASVSNQAITLSDYLTTSSQYANASTADQNTPRITITQLPANSDVYNLNRNGANNATITFRKNGYYTLKVTFEWNDGYTYNEVMCFEVTQIP